MELLENINQLSGKADRELADSVLQVSVEANKKIVEELMGDENMCEALMEIMEPQLLKREREVRQEAIQVAVEVLRDIGQEDVEIRSILVTKYGLTAEEADEYLRKKV